MKRILLCFGFVAMLTGSGCSSGPAVIPPELEPQIDSSVSFPQILASPGTYVGKTVILGGEVLSAKRLKEGTQLEILQLPVSEDRPPAERRSESQGRFLAFNRGPLDPAALPDGTRVTVVGTVIGDSLQPLDESEYRYPTIDVKHLHVWDAAAYARYRRAPPTVGLFGGMGFGFGGGRSGSFGGVGIGTGF
jgi:outer membrane lipoprotein